MRLERAERAQKAVDLDILRTVLFRPYLRGKEPSFVLTMWDTHRTDNRGQTRIGYRLTQIERTMVGALFLVASNGERLAPIVETALSPSVIFEGEDFSGSPMHADDSDETVKGLMGFLTLRPGDTDSEYFDNYTEAQETFASDHAEDLGAYCISRFEGPNVSDRVYVETATDRGAPLPAYTSLGSYTLIYRRDDNTEVCAACASENSRESAQVSHVGTYDEGEPLECDECGREIESSYGPTYGL